jgi:hypothetical protein
VTKTIRQSLKVRVRIADGLLLLGIIIAGGGILIWQWHSHVELMIAGLVLLIIGGLVRLGVRCPKCTFVLSRPRNFCPNCGVSFDNPRY